MDNDEWAKWMKVELGIAGAALIVLCVCWALGAVDWRVALGVPIGIVIMGEIQRDNLILARHRQRERERETR